MFSIQFNKANNSFLYYYSDKDVSYQHLMTDFRIKKEYFSLISENIWTYKDIIIERYDQEFTISNINSDLECYIDIRVDNFSLKLINSNIRNFNISNLFYLSVNNTIFLENVTIENLMLIKRNCVKTVYYSSKNCKFHIDKNYNCDILDILKNPIISIREFNNFIIENRLEKIDLNLYVKNIKLILNKYIFNRDDKKNIFTYTEIKEILDNIKFVSNEIIDYCNIYWEISSAFYYKFLKNENIEFPICNVCKNLTLHNTTCNSNNKHYLCRICYTNMLNSNGIISCPCCREKCSLTY